MENNTTMAPAAAQGETCLPGLDHRLPQKLMLEVSGITQACVLTILSLWTTFSNLIILVAIVRFCTNRTAYPWVLCSQVFADFMTGASVMPLSLSMAVEFLVSLKTSCQIGHSSRILAYFFYFHWVSTLGTLSNFAMSSIDRYYAVSRPLRYRATVRVQRVKRFLVAFWIFLFVFELMLYRVAVVQVSLLLAALLNTIIFQILVFKSVHRYNATRANNLGNNSIADAVIKQEKTMAKRIGLLIATLCVCTLPMIVFVVVQVTSAKLIESWHAVIAPWTTLIFYTSSALDPFLYCWKNETVKKAIKKLLRVDRADTATGGAWQKASVVCPSTNANGHPRQQENNP